MTEVGGTVDPAFAAVGEAFRENFADGEVGASCCITVEDRTVVDLWGGWAERESRRPWRRDTLVDAYSVGKPVVALMVLQAIEHGLVALDDPITAAWPELVAGQHGATVRHALCHRAGIPAIRTPLTDHDLWDWSTMCAALAGTEPWWTPGTAHAYHTNTYGHLVGELGRRLDGQTPGTWLREAVGEPLGADLWWGVPGSEQARVAEVIWEGAVPGAPPAARADDDGPVAAMGEGARRRRQLEAQLDGLTPEQQMVVLGYVNPPGYSSLGVVNTPEWRGAQVPSTNLHASADGVARLYTALAAGGTLDGVRLLGEDLLGEATSTQSEGWCPVLERQVSFGLGFQPTRPDRPFGPNPGAFGHFGTGGALGFADPVARVGFGYVMNAVKPRWQSSRNRRLVAALYDCL